MFLDEKRRSEKRTYLIENAVRLGIPARMNGSIVRYVLDHKEPGDFLQAVLKNNLREACSLADDQNALLLRQYMIFFYNHAPITCWGSPQVYEAWTASGN